MNTEGSVEFFDKICSDYGVGHISNNKNMGKRATKAKVEFGHALAVGFNARSVDSLEREATVEPLAICGCRGDGADGSTRVHHEAFSGITLTNEKHTAWSRFTRR